MKLIFERDGVKREICAPFAICAAKADLVALRDQLERVIAREDWVYGWVEVWPRVEQRSNTVPLPWVENSDSKPS